MILDSLAHCADYFSLHPLFSKAFDYLQRFDPATPDGKYELEGDRLFAAVQRYETAPEASKVWETHRVYADIQCVFAGRERIYYAPAEELRAKIPYNEAKDIEKFDADCVKHAVPMVISAGNFCVFLPQDGHQPGCMVDQPESVLKVVIKVRLR